VGELLRADRISKSFGAVAALREVSFSLMPGEIRAICGENGAGKSTLVKILMGVHRPDSGFVAIDGTARDLRTPKMAQRMGLAMVAQELSLTPHLSVLDNIWLGNASVPFFHRRIALRQKAEAALKQLGAGHYDLDRPTGSLTIGERQVVEIARLMARDARLLILDEPTASLSDREIERIFVALKSLKADGRAVLYITHRLGEVFEVCDTVTVLRNGEHVATKAIEGLGRESLIELMLGRKLEDRYVGTPPTTTNEGVLTVENLTVPGAVQNMRFGAPRGKILCIAGQLGSGAQQVLRAIAGLVPDATGTIRVNGEVLRPGSVRRALRHNVLFIPEDRASEGVFLNRSVVDNLTVLRLPQHRRFGMLGRRRLRATAARLGVKVGVDGQRLSANASDLSGGNQQKLLFGRGLDHTEPGLLLMNEPTRGVDVGSRAEIYRLMRAFCELGYALVMTSTDIEEVVGIADIVITMFRGRIIAQREGRDISMHAILADITNPTNTAAA
jgi:ABC-type sugar transport system ATPase subunit